MEHRVLVTGGRNWNDWSLILTELIEYPRDHTVVIEGGARGADLLAKKIAKILFGKNNIGKDNVEEYPANWNQFGKAAGPIRNQQMLDEGLPTVVLAFHSNIAESRGTKDMIKRALKADRLPVKLIVNSEVALFNDEILEKL